MGVRVRVGVRVSVGVRVEVRGWGKTSEGEAHLTSEYSHRTSYDQSTSPAALMGCGGMSCVTGLALEQVLSAAVAPSRPLKGGVYACLTEKGSTSKPTRREPEKCGSLWYLVRGSSRAWGVGLGLGLGVGSGVRVRARLRIRFRVKDAVAVLEHEPVVVVDIVDAVLRARDVG